MTDVTSLKFGDHEVLPGQSKKILFPMPELYDGSPLHLAAHVIRGKEPGPIVCLFGAVHGDELNGIEIIRRVLKNKKCRRIKGTIIAVPVVNVYGLVYQQRYLMDRRDLNRSFPGSAGGSIASRLAHLVVNSFVKKATHIIDLHTGSLHRSNLPQIRTSLKNEVQKKLAIAFNAPVILDAGERQGSLREVAGKHSIPYLLYESGEALRLDESAIKIGVNGIFKVLSKLKMIKVEECKNKIPPALSEESVWVRSKINGLFQAKKNLGKEVSTGDVLGWVSDPLGTRDTKIISPISGIIIGMNNIPLVHAGAALFHIAIFEKLTKQQIAALDLVDDEDIDDLMFTDE